MSTLFKKRDGTWRGGVNGADEKDDSTRKYMSVVSMLEKDDVLAQATLSVVGKREFAELLKDEQERILDIFDICQSLMSPPKATTTKDETRSILRRTAGLCLHVLSNTSPNPEGVDASEKKKEIIRKNAELFIRKNNDYGDSFKDFGLLGILVRMNDKINRAKRLISISSESSTSSSSVPSVLDESLEDTLNDLYNYSAIGLMYCQ